MRAPNSKFTGREVHAESAGTPARRSALRLLDAVLRKGLPLDAALSGATSELDRPDDRALAHAIAAETLRRLPDLDALIDGATAKPLPDDAKARFALRIALVQVLVLGTPPHAAIATALSLVDGGPRKLVHGVFGALMRAEALLPELPNLPVAVDMRWEAAWGEEMAEAARAAIATPPPLDLTLADWSQTKRWVEELGGISLMPGHVRLPRSGDVREMPGFEEGAWWVQDLAASLPARLLGRGSGEVLDLCAAPGGKTLQLASAGWSVTALDSSEARLARLADNLERTKLTAKTVIGDVLRWAPGAPSDAILLDAPCSATGIFRRHPDVLHRVTPRLVAETAALQSKMLPRAAQWLKPGGTFVYATCSLEKAEGEDQLTALLSARKDFSVNPIRQEELPTGLSPTDGGWVRTLPGMLADQGGLDGFFIVRLTRKV